MMTYLTFNQLINFQNDHIFQHNGDINVDKKCTFLRKRNLFKKKIEAIKSYYGDEITLFPI